MSAAEYFEATVDANHRRSQLGCKRFVFHWQVAFVRWGPGSLSSSNHYKVNVSVAIKTLGCIVSTTITYMIGISSKCVLRASAMLTSDMILILACLVRDLGMCRSRD